MNLDTRAAYAIDYTKLPNCFHMDEADKQFNREEIRELCRIIFNELKSKFSPKNGSFAEAKTNDDSIIENFANQLIRYQESRNFNAAEKAANKFIKDIELRLTISTLSLQVDNTSKIESKITPDHQQLFSQEKSVSHKPKKHSKSGNNHHPRAHRPY